MARLHRGQGSRAIIAALASLLVLSPGLPAWSADDAAPPFYDRPTLVVDPGMHTATIRTVAVDKSGRFAATGSEDKTVRIWSLADGKLLQTIRVPAGPGNVGKVYAIALSPDSGLLAVGGWLLSGDEDALYLFDLGTGAIVRRITGLPNVALQLAFSPDGRYLAAGLGGSGGLSVYGRDKDWAEVFRDKDYGNQTYGLAFADDGRLATSNYDGKVRLYNPSFGRVVTWQAPSRLSPRGLAFNPDGTVLALTYRDAVAVHLLDGHTLTPLQSPNTEGLGGSLDEVAWSKDGRTLFAGGKHVPRKGKQVLAWADAGRGERRALAVARHTIMGIAALLADRLLVGTADPYLAVLESDGSALWAHQSPQAQFLGQESSFAISPDGTIVDFGFEEFGKSPLRFNLRNLTLSADSPADQLTLQPKQAGLSIENWIDSSGPTLNGRDIALKSLELSRSLAVRPDNDGFILGADFTMNAYDAKGKRIWRREVPGTAWAVNITSDGRLVVAAYDDGTIRWHRMDDGRELLAFMVLGDRKNWVAWTPEGFYAATPGAHGVLQWHVNRGAEAAAATVPVSAIPKLRRPDALVHVLRELETARALGIADMAAARYDVQVATGAAKAPGARLHVLTVGVSDYGDKAKHLRLEFAHKDAHDVASALVNTQGSIFNKRGGLYAEVLPIHLEDKMADRAGIAEAFAALQRNMAKNSGGNDLAVVMFSGHGAVIDDRFYLLPHGVDAATPARLKASAYPASEFQAEVEKLARHGRVLVLLDACRSGAMADGSKLAPNPDLLRGLLAQSNVTVLTSSKADKLSREDRKWGNGAFTKVLLEAFGRAADIDNNGVISMSELTAYLTAHLPNLTGGEQHPGMEQRFQSDILVAGL
ncbi:MAG TPA: caspase family protein [Beijerinckiaceae bacterium]|jgi:hypothetical protein